MDMQTKSSDLVLVHPFLKCESFPALFVSPSLPLFALLLFIEFIYWLLLGPQLLTLFQSQVIADWNHTKNNPSLKGTGTK